MDPLSDQDCVARARKGDAKAFELLVTRYERRVFAFALRRMGNRQDAEDVVVLSFAKAYRQLHRYRPRYAFSTWLFTLVRNEAVSQWRKRKPYLAPMGPDFSNATPDKSVISEEEEGVIWHIARERLSPDQFDAIWLKYGEHLSLKEMAIELRKTTGATKVLLHRARHLLREALTENDTNLASTYPRIALEVQYDT